MSLVTRLAQPRTLLRLFAASVLLVTATTAHAAAQAAAPQQAVVPGEQWPGYNKDLDGQRYSLLKQLNTGNAATLAEVCRIEVAHRGSFQAGPLVVDGTMYVTVEEQTIALDPVSCQVKWRHAYRHEQAGMVAINRGVAYDNGRLFRGTDDARVLALDAASGRELWKSIAGDARLAEYIGGAPLAWNGLVFVGTAGSEWGIRGRILAFDGATGREVWRFSTIPTGNEPGAASWKDRKWAEHGGGGTWSPFALDPVTAELFVPVGNPVPDFSPGDRPGANLFTNSLVVLDARSGKVKWWFQLSPNDGMDWDLAAPPMLYRNGSDRDLVAVAGKDGYLYAIDRNTHRLVFKVPTTTVNSQRPRPGVQGGVKVCPGALGGTLWNGPAYDPANQTIFTGAIDECTVVTPAPGQTYATGTMLYGGTWQVPTEPATGWITAVDANTGKVRWKFHTDSPVLGAITPTAGGIVMAGDNSGALYVFDSRSGELLQRLETHGSISGGIVTYQLKDVQYVAVTSGNISKSGFGAIGRPSVLVLRAAAAQAQGESAAASAERGADVYKHNCMGCHATDGSGIPGHSLVDLKTRMTKEQLLAWVRDPKPPMPRVFPEPMESDDLRDLDDLAAYLLR
jgi:alcohol dehydrogenase (cytochrome c)